MIKRYYFVLAAVVAILATFATQNAVSAQNINRCRDNGRGLLMIGLTADQRLICFRDEFASRAAVIGPISGLSGDSALIGMDYRVQDGQLYGVGNAGGVYRVNTGNGAATLVNNLTIALDGTSFGVDFNPAADRLRIISNTGQNLRHNVNAGGVTINDGTLTYTAPPASPVAALGVTGAAYTNNDLDTSTATTLFDVDSALDQIAIQSPANNGILAATGKLGVDTNDLVGFDIYTTLEGGVSVGNDGYASLTSAGGSSGLYSVSLLTGRATLISGFGMGVQIADIAIPLNQQ